MEHKELAAANPISQRLSILILVGLPALAGVRREVSATIVPNSMEKGWLHGQNPPPAPDLSGIWTGVTGLSVRKNVFTLTLARKGESYLGTISDAAGLMKQVPLEDARNAGGGLAGPVSEWEKILIAALPQVKYVSEPDTRYLYSNVSYAILGAALGKVAGRPYTEYVGERILAPLGMIHTGFELDAEMRGKLAKGYDVGRDGKAHPEGAARDLEAGRSANCIAPRSWRRRSFRRVANSRRSGSSASPPTGTPTSSAGM